MVRGAFAGLARGADIEGAWRKFLHEGFLADSAAKPVEVKLDGQAVANAISSAPKSVAPGKDSLEIAFPRESSLGDGRHNHNGWLPGRRAPTTTLCWRNAAWSARKNAHDL